MRFTEELRQGIGEQWERVVFHRFTDELAEGTIDRNCLKLYLIQDHRFLDSFIVLLASIIAKARCLDDRIPASQFLGLITDTENTYFERSFESLGVTLEQRKSTPDAPCLVKFCNLMRKVSESGNLGEMLTVVVVCEWSYLTWGERVLSKTVRDNFFTYEWVDLHSGTYFTNFVEYLRNLLDKEGELMDSSARNSCKEIFLQAFQLEEEFFDYAYSSSSSSSTS